VKHYLKPVTVLILTLLLGFILSGCWNSREINDLAFAVSMGFDKAEDGILLTVQILNARAIASQKAVQEPTVVVYSETGADTMEILRKLVTQTSRKINVTHLQTIVFGEDFAKEGIGDVLDFFLREHQVRTDVYFAVAKETSANSVLHVLTSLETNPAVKLTNSIQASGEIWAASKSIKLIKLVSDIACEGTSAVLTGVQLIGDIEGHDSLDILKNMEPDPLKIINLAVFKKDKLAGWLDEYECKGYNYIIGNVSSSAGHLDTPETGLVTFEIKGAKSKQTASFEGGKPTMNLDIEINMNIESSSNHYDVSKKENLEKLEKLCDEKITGYVTQVLKKAQKDLTSDIFGFGEVFHRSYPKQWDKLKENWSNEFSILPVNVTVKTKIEGTGTMSKSIFYQDEGDK